MLYQKCMHVYTSFYMCPSARLYPSKINKLENSVAAHWFLPFQNMLSPKNIYP